MARNTSAELLPHCIKHRACIASVLAIIACCWLNLLPPPQPIPPPQPMPPPTGDIQDALTKCLPVAPSDQQTLKSEIEHYEKSERFKHKIEEVRGDRGVAATHLAIEGYLKEKVLQQEWSSVLELGCAAGMMLKMVQRAYKEESVPTIPRDFVGVELVTGWVKFANIFFKGSDIEVIEGDITDFTFPAPYNSRKFDFVMLNDVAEHIQVGRYGCFFQKLRDVTHPGSVVYMHTPTPAAQIVDTGQYFENVLPHHFVIMGMARAGFQLVNFEHDVDTKCGGSLRKDAPHIVQSAKCSMGGFPKYYHIVFQRVSNLKELTLA